MKGGAAGRVMGVALLFVASLAAADSPFDPGAGYDASNSVDAPTMLPGFGAYSGDLPASDADWYAVDSTASAACIVLEAVANVGYDLTLATRGVSPHSIKTPVPPNLGTRIALAQPGVTRTLVGIEGTPSVSGNYEFTVTRYTLESFTGGDGGTSGDAPSIPQGALPVKGSCVKGTVGLKDSADVYAFNASMGDQVVYSLAATGASSPSLRVLDATGAPLGTIIGSGGIGSLSVPSAGTYYVAVSVPLDSSSSGYLVGLVGPDPPPGSPCRPHCMVS